MPLFNRRRQLPSDQFSRAEGNAMIPRWTRPPERNTYDWIKTVSYTHLTLPTNSLV